MRCPLDFHAVFRLARPRFEGALPYGPLSFSFPIKGLLTAHPEAGKPEQRRVPMLQPRPSNGGTAGIVRVNNCAARSSDTRAGQPGSVEKPRPAARCCQPISGVDPLQTFILGLRMSALQRAQPYGLLKSRPGSSRSTSAVSEGQRQSVLDKPVRRISHRASHEMRLHEVVHTTRLRGRNVDIAHAEPGLGMP